ncbi:hypothetical protein C2S53_019084 [Perilla frutescens var. hirtella]|uniref:Uncharacterized protein n=1 Tax=Perilla frutescens var. hirtella TaxID=608512 RepID=A0AAD4J5T0_PERFH|nr:hypothetical protein C2S53_019084 [Perilla frutescens var. hirtella]
MGVEKDRSAGDEIHHQYLLQGRYMDDNTNEMERRSSCGRALHALLAREINIPGAPKHEDLLQIFKERHVSGAADDDYLKVANILALYSFRLGYDPSRRVESFAWALVDDLDAWNNFSWGVYTFTSLLHYISLLPKTKKGCGTKYHFYGPAWALQIGCHETLTIDKAKQERPYWNSIHCAESIGTLFPTPSNPIASRRDPDQKPSKHKRAHKTRSSSSNSGDYDKRASSLVGKIKEALMPDIINYLKHDLIDDVKNALLPDLKEFIQTLKCGSR